MLIATQSKNIAGTQKYFESVLTQGDYYLGQEVAGHWYGRGTAILGLEEGAQVTKDQFSRLLAGHHPISGKRLAQRARKDRRPGMDLTFSVPKSVSLAWAINNDERILQALREVVRETMAADVEPLMERRVRAGKHAATKHKTATGKLIYADFLHKTSRPVDGSPDPHLHVHAFVINWTEEAGKHYAGEFEEIVRQRASLQAKFESRLARRLNELGYGAEHVQFLQSGKLKRGWELTGIARETVEKFSRRTAQVEAYAEENDIRDAERKGRLGKLTRERKGQSQRIDRLRDEWRSRLTPAEMAAFASLRKPRETYDEGRELGWAVASVHYALEHHLYRHSTVERHQVVATALEHGLNLCPKKVEQALDSLELIQRQVDVNGSMRHLITTRAVLDAEREMIAYAREGRGTRKAISSSNHNFTRDWLNDGQKAAVRHVLQSRDTVTAIVGAAGSGKTSLMQEAVEAIMQRGKRVFTFAPSTGAKEVLQEKGFHNAQTVEHLIRNTKLHEQLREQVLWIDEAGLLDVRSMNKVFQIAKEQNARVILSGDTRQHATPRRGEAMRLLESEAGLKLARSEKILRQQGEYRQAVALISKGYEVVDDRTGATGLVAGYDMLDRLGKIHEITADDRHQKLAQAYLQNANDGKSTLIIAPTHAESRAATAEIRAQLRAQGKLSDQEKEFVQYRSLNLSEAEKTDAKTYAGQEGFVVQFHQNAKEGIKRGDRFRIVSARNGEVTMTALGRGQSEKRLPLDAASRFEVYTEEKLRIAPGDKIRFSLGGTTKDKQGRISNGRLDEVKGFDRQGNIMLRNGWTVDRNYAHLDLGYVVTSHASQGKDRQVAIGAMGAESLPAINARQFYVTVSRGRDDVMLFVDDKAKVRSAIQRSGVQIAATEMIGSWANEQAHTAVRSSARQAAQQRVTFRDRLSRWWQRFRSGREGRRSAVGRHRQAAAMQRGGPGSMGMLPGLERGRTI